jgi:hypothetical protein
MEGLECQCSPSNHGRASNFKTSFARDDIKHEDWRRLVTIYSTKNFTNPKDLLPALEGIANRVRGAGRYIAGMWETWLLEDLAWYSVIQSEDALTENNKDRALRPYRIPEPNSPSFSWSSVVGSKSFLDNISSTSLENACELVSYLMPEKMLLIRGQFLNGFFLNQFESPLPTGAFIKHSNEEQKCLWATLHVPQVGHFIFHPDSSADALEWASSEHPVPLVCLQLCSSTSRTDDTCYGLVLKSDSWWDYTRVGFIASMTKQDFEHGEITQISLS